MNSSKKLLVVLLTAFAVLGSSYVIGQSVQLFERTDTFFIASDYFETPHGITTNDTHIFVADTDNNRVQIFRSSDLVNVKTIEGVELRPLGSSFRPDGIETNSTHLFVMSNTHGQVVVFGHNSGVLEHTIDIDDDGCTGIGEQEAIIVNQTHIFITDSCYNWVDIYRQSDGEHVNTITNGFSSPNDIAVNQTHIFVADAGNDQVQILRQSDGIGVKNVTGSFTNPTEVTQTGGYLFVYAGNMVHSISQSDFMQASPPFSVGAYDKYDMDSNSTHFFIVGRDYNDNFQIYENFLSACEDGKIIVNNQCVTRISEDSCKPYEEANDRYNECLIPDCRGEGKLIRNHECVDEPNKNDPELDTQGISAAGIGVDNPFGIAENQTHIFVTRPDANQVSIRDKSDLNGENIGTIQVDSPRAIATNSTHVFVTDLANEQVVIFRQSDGEKSQPIQVSEITNSESKNAPDLASHDPRKCSDQRAPSCDELEGSRGLATNSTHLFVENNRELQIFSLSDGENVKNVMGTFGDLATNSTHLFSADFTNNKIDIFDQDTLEQDSAVYVKDASLVAVSEDHIVAVEREDGNDDFWVFRQSDGKQLYRILIRDVKDVDAITVNSTHIYATAPQIGAVAEIRYNIVCAEPQQVLVDAYCIDPVEITSDSSRTNVREFTVEGTAEDGAKVTLTHNDNPPVPVTATGGSWSVDVILDNPDNVFIATAAVFGVAPPPAEKSKELDTIPPDVEITTPTGTSSTSSSFTVEGTAEDGAMVTLIQDGVPLTPINAADAVWSIPVTLVRDKTSFTATASDGLNTSPETDPPVVITLVDMPTQEPKRSSGGNSNSGLPPDPRVCGGVLCSEVVSVPADTVPTCGAGTQKINGICVIDRPGVPDKPQPLCDTGEEEIDGKCVPGREEGQPKSEEEETPEDVAKPATETPEYIAEPTGETEYIPEPTDEAETNNMQGVKSERVPEDSKAPKVESDPIAEFIRSIMSFFGQ